MSDIKLPYIKWRGGRPRFHPSAREQRLGFRGEDLKDDAGGWLTLDRTKAWADARLAEIKTARQQQARRGRGGRRTLTPDRCGGTVRHLLEDWLIALRTDQDPQTRLSPDTIESYEKAAAACIWKPEARAARALRRQKERAAQILGQEPPERAAEKFGQADVRAIDKIALHDFFLYLQKARGHHMAHAAVAAFSAAYTWGGLDRRWRLGRNPRHDLDLPRPKGRIVIYSDTELRVLIEAADKAGRASVGDSIMLALFTAQRQRDRVFLADEGLIDGRRHFRQSKTGKLIAVREAPQLAERMAAARARVGRLALAAGLSNEDRPATVIVDEATIATYNQDTYRHIFAEVRAAASIKMPSLANKRDQDLRDTSVTWLARAGCTLLEICAISGHSPRSAQTIIKHYLGSQAELADAGVDKLIAWMAREGIAV